MRTARPAAFVQSPDHSEGILVAADDKIHIVGIGADGIAGLTGKARELLQTADVLLGSEQTLGLISETKAEKAKIGADLNETVQAIERLSGNRKLVLVASGDPLFYGVAR